MKSLFTIAILLIGFNSINLYGQELTKKELREKKNHEKQLLVDSLINSKTFLFVAYRALPQGYKPVDLTTHNNRVQYFTDSIDSYLSFFGRAYSVGYSNDNGLIFNGKPTNYTITKGKKNYMVKADVRGEGDTFKLSLNVSFSGSATLNVYSNKRSTISYHGEIEKLTEKKKE